MPTLDYSRVSLIAPVPAGADTARVVCAIQSFTNGTLPDVGTVFVDDASLRIIPEPATVGLWGIALFALTVARRRRWLDSLTESQRYLVSRGAATRFDVQVTVEISGIASLDVSPARHNGVSAH